MKCSKIAPKLRNVTTGQPNRELYPAIRCKCSTVFGQTNQGQHVGAVVPWVSMTWVEGRKRCDRLEVEIIAGPDDGLECLLLGIRELPGQFLLGFFSIAESCRYSSTYRRSQSN
jgi:hypothetical protein